jgi:hypothetical protein
MGLNRAVEVLPCNHSQWPIRIVRAGIRDRSGKYIEAIELFGPDLIEEQHKRQPQLGFKHRL